jgi:hypothetical protein
VTISAKPTVLRMLVGVIFMLSLSPAKAEMRPTLNLSGQVGLIDMPSGDQMPDGFLTYDHSRFGPVLKNSLRFQITPRLSGIFRYVGLHGWNQNLCPPDCKGANIFPIYYDRNFDISYQILTEGRYLPAITVGLQDFIGTGLSAAEYIAATKTFDRRVKVTAGLGFGRLGSYNPIGQPLGPRANVAIGNGGNFNIKQWFHGDAAPFAGVEYMVNDKWTAKLEYSSDIYAEEAGRRGMFERKSPFNFGVEFQQNDTFRFGAYYMYGSQLGLNLSVTLNPAQRPAGGMGGPAPLPVIVRPSPRGDPAAWGTDWLAQSDVKEVLIGNLTRNLDQTGIEIESLGVTRDTAQVRFRNTKYDAAAQAVGRVARAMSRVMPASVERFEIVPMDHGIPGAKVVLARSDLEQFEFAPDGAASLLVRTDLVDGGVPLPGTAFNSQLYPRFSWALTPFLRTRQFDPANPLQAGIGARLGARYEIASGLYVSGAVTDLFASNIKDRKIPNPSVLPHVRSDAARYDTRANPDLESLTIAYYTRLSPNIYGRVTAGYLERMFGGLSTEVLYRPINRNWALAAEANYVRQRDSNGGLGFGEYNYGVVTGHVSGYYDFGNGFHAQVDVGRYLAGDVGATLAVTREFANGWRIGAFATKTNVSAAKFGEGSFDKGITLQIPFSWLTGQPTRAFRPVVIRPIGRDGGARLDVNDRLYEVLRSYDQTRLDAQWGRVLK